MTIVSVKPQECPLLSFHVKFNPLTKTGKEKKSLMNIDVEKGYHLKVASHVLPLEREAQIYMTNWEKPCNRHFFCCYIEDIAELSLSSQRKAYMQ